MSSCKPEALLFDGNIINGREYGKDLYLRYKTLIFKLKRVILLSIRLKGCTLCAKCNFCAIEPCDSGSSLPIGWRSKPRGIPLQLHPKVA
jgi:hypothetical protein